MTRLQTTLLPLATLAIACSDPASSLPSALDTRLEHDRTGACIAAAVLSDGRTERAIRCSDQGVPRRLDTGTPFEIGSLTKTMTGFLLADRVRAGQLRLDAPLSDFAPSDVRVPSFDREPIRLVHLATHSAGLPRLPSRMEIDDEGDPYRTLTDAQVWSSLGDVELTAAPGSSWDYSNFGFMLLSRVMADASGEGFAELLRARLFAPLGMGAFVITAEDDGRLAAGHGSSGRAVPHWHIATDLAGDGGVAASLDDLVRYARAVLGDAPANTAAALHDATTAQPTPRTGIAMGLGWLRGGPGNESVVFHDGGTGGFSSFVAIDLAARRAVVLLSDTNWTDLGGLGPLGTHLLDPGAAPQPLPRQRATPPAELLSALAGRYALGDVTVTLDVADGKLRGTVDGDSYTLAYDSYGDFYPVDLDALLTPVRRPDGAYDFDWAQGGSVTRAERLP
jgi:D-alanyl-D-alanine-carboxypeptidase/D-alanyl-D-alanine-endopeptidase